jgi:high-affinity iron transporter
MNFTISGRAIAVAAGFFALLAVAATAGAEPTPRDALRSVVERYSVSQAAAAKREAADAFFLFEGSALDRDLAARDPSLYRTVEAEWMHLLSAMDAGRPEAEVKAQGERVLTLLERGAERAAGGGSIFLDSLLIILREGFEAILIMSALAAYLVRIGQRSRLPFLYAGAGVAVVVSIALWVTARSVIDLSGSQREAFEGWTILLAAGVLFWVSYWLISKAEADRWQAFVKSRVERAVSRGALLGLGFLSFIVVFREGLETVLFYEAVAARARDASDHSMLVAGFLTGCGALTALYLAFQSIGPRLPMRAFFNVTGGLLYFMAFRFAGAGVRELQEAGALAQTPVSPLPDSAALAQWLGIYPYLEPLALQALLLLLAAIAFAHTLRHRARDVDAQTTTVEARRRVAGGRQA